MKPKSTKKPSTAKRARPSANAFPEAVEQHLEVIAREMAGKPLSEALTEKAPLKQLIARVAQDWPWKRNSPNTSAMTAMNASTRASRVRAVAATRAMATPKNS